MLIYLRTSEASPSVIHLCFLGQDDTPAGVVFGDVLPGDDLLELVKPSLGFGLLLVGSTRSVVLGGRGGGGGRGSRAGTALGSSGRRRWRAGRAQA